MSTDQERTYPVANPSQTPNGCNQTWEVRLQLIRAVVKRKQPRSSAKVPNARAKWRRMWRFINNQDIGSEAATIQECANSSLVERRCAEDVRAQARNRNCNGACNLVKRSYHGEAVP